ncbi:MAG: nucleotide sugar dehydrogenase [Alphaproteobacteria bacterium]|nr:nucleotide sugar dehydrogenase [Alphaproteobacteria bacterium]MCB9931516.1 nucleotide sugar dehydrogenase [Alphaproteobacteria bacterium]
MTVVVCGLATVGASMAAWLLERGHTVVGVDTDASKREAVAGGRAPVSEPGMAEAFADGVATGRLSVADDLARAMMDPAVDTVAIAVGTPRAEDGSLSLAQIHAATNAVIDGIRRRPDGSPAVLICYRSTVPPGTCRDVLLPKLEQALGPAGGWFEIAYHPEFLRMGHGLEDAREPGRIVLGERYPGASRRLNGIYGNPAGQVFEIDFASAELAKMADNTWRAAKVAFANETARLAMATGAAPQEVMRVLTADARYNLSGAYLTPGLPFGGYCLPKDSAGIAEAAAEWGVETPLFAALNRSNAAHADAIVTALLAQYPAGSRLLQMGLGFKPGSDDLRESPLCDLAERLLACGICLAIWDPAFPDPGGLPASLRSSWCGEPDTRDVDAIILGHPWPRAARRPLAPMIDLTHLSSLQPALP